MSLFDKTAKIGSPGNVYLCGHRARPSGQPTPLSGPKQSAQAGFPSVGIGLRVVFGRVENL